MCLLALLHRVAEDAPVVVGANREEFYERGGDPPRRLDGVQAIGGVDPSQGGTWLGVNSNGLLIAVTNRFATRMPEAPRSRGLLVRDLLGLPSAGLAVREALRQIETGHYAGCNLLCADAREAVVIHAGDWLRVRTLPPGIHVLSNRDVNDPTDGRVVYALDWLARQTLARADLAVSALCQLCASREPAMAPMCFRHEKRGTVCSSVLALRQDLGDSLYLHAQGAPDRTTYTDVSDLLHELITCSPASS
jgi:uncharacterized protein with NRDE domain